MNQFDFFIIYLTCGAPLAVFYFFQNKNEVKNHNLWLKTFLTFLFWMPLGFRLLRTQILKSFQSKKAESAKNSEIESEVFLFQKYLEELLRTSNLPISIFEFREVFDRYVGLTISQNNKSSSTEIGKEIFQIADVRQLEISVICLNRRNQSRLKFHQIQSRKDFFRIIEQLALVTPHLEKFTNSTGEFFRLINDAEAQKMNSELLFDKFEARKDFVATGSENFLWNTESYNLPQTKSNLIRFQPLARTAKSSIKD